jgi:alpha-beta hydrolase superfamily lysophospholipase
MRTVLKHSAYALAYGVLGAGIALIVLYVAGLRAQPDLQAWHRVHFESEFRAADTDRIRTLADYLALEERLFQELREKVYTPSQGRERARYARFSSGSLSDPLAQQPNWNRTFELPAPNPVGGALLLHGLSDSPYSLRALAEHLHRRGYWVVGLRLPGHGTAPSGLLDAQWEDFAAAARIGARHVRERIGDEAPLLLAGYSNGAALAVEYALARLQGADLPRTDGLVLISPAIGIAPAAAFAVWQGRLGALIGEEKLGWSDIQPEYDPYKYASFAINAGDQSYRLTRRIAGQLDALGGGESLRGMPPVLAFQSVADATVSTPAVIDGLFRRLLPGGHHLVLFDINRHSDALLFYRDAATRVRENLLRGPPLPFELTVLTNQATESAALTAMIRPALQSKVSMEQTALSWPPGVFSLSHVALPFGPDDPIYGERRPPGLQAIYLGRVDLLGERGVLAVPPAQLLRLRYNPFFPYLQRRIDLFLAPLEQRVR